MRVASGNHFLTNVLCGAIAGSAIGYLVPFVNSFCFFAVLAGFSVLVGDLELTLQNIQSSGKQKAELILSGMFSSLGIVFSAMTYQPDLCIMFFALFIIKVLAALKTQK